MKKYQLTLTAKQAQVLEDALDLYGRVGMGQFQEILNVHGNRPAQIDLRDGAMALLGHVHELVTGLPRNSYFGILSDKISDKFRMAYDLQQVIRHRLAWDRDPNGGPSKGVRFDAPRKTSEEPLPHIE